MHQVLQPYERIVFQTLAIWLNYDLALSVLAVMSAPPVLYTMEPKKSCQHLPYLDMGFDLCHYISRASSYRCLF